MPLLLALDMTGPFKTEGQDFNESRHRYLVVGASRLPVQFFKDPSDPSVKDEEVPEDRPLEGDGVSGPDPLDLEADDWQDPDYTPDFEEEVAREGFQKDSGDAEPSEEKDELEEEVKGLTKPLELRTLCMVQPLLSRKGPEVLRAVRQFKVQLLTLASSNQGLDGRSGYSSLPTQWVRASRQLDSSVRG